MSGRQAATALAKLTWGFAAAFFVTSIALTVLAFNFVGDGLRDALDPRALA